MVVLSSLDLLGKIGNRSEDSGGACAQGLQSVTQKVPIDGLFLPTDNGQSQMHLHHENKTQALGSDPSEKLGCTTD